MSNQSCGPDVLAGWSRIVMLFGVCGESFWLISDMLQRVVRLARFNRLVSEALESRRSVLVFAQVCSSTLRGQRKATASLRRSVSSED